ncbi:MAG: SoxR reducing system RseC family protein [Bacteroides sp.]|nr:SoxR reducing system RseC family protein [Bacteroidaceae bacterium]MBQ8873918.1 SoxR reducing system RseC family protein [Bacteroides sp.]
MADIIKHRGIVVKIDGSHVVVRIVQTSACSACSAKGLCNASESKEKQIDVYEVNPAYRIGEEVVLCGSTSMGMKAVFLAFGIPVLLLLAVLFVTMRITDGDALLAAAVALLAVVPYYVVIYLMKDKMNKTFSFVIEKQ